MQQMEIKRLNTDVLIIGGGTAGCYAALTLRKHSDVSVLIAEKADIRRSGCLAAGVNAINAYITEGKTPEDYVAYAREDADGIVREDLLLSAARRFNEVTEHLEELGLVILKDENGAYAARGTRNIKINGENIKPLLAEAVKKAENVTVINHVNITELLVKNNRVYGASGFSVKEPVLYEITAKAVLCATGGAAGLYRPNNPGFSRHKMWYPPFLTGAGYAMGIRAGAEMTTFEMRFIALRCKDTIAPTGTIAQGAGAKQVNALGEVYETKYGLKTSERVYGTLRENLEGRGPCYLRTEGISNEQEQELEKAYLNMAPSQTLKWIEGGKGPSEENVEIEGTEPYVVGGHTASGYWVDTQRRTTLAGLYAAGDVAGGCPQKYVTGAMAEGEIAAEAIVTDLKSQEQKKAAQEENRQNIPANEQKGADGLKGEISSEEMEEFFERKREEASQILAKEDAIFTTEQLEEAMQKVMDAYAGGIGANYQFNEKQLLIAQEKIREIKRLSETLSAQDMHELLFVYELKERLLVCEVLIAHLLARKETRWHCFAENADYPEKSDAWLQYVNSRQEDGQIQILLRPLVKGERYEHSY